MLRSFIQSFIWVLCLAPSSGWATVESLPTVSDYRLAVQDLNQASDPKEVLKKASDILMTYGGFTEVKIDSKPSPKETEILVTLARTLLDILPKVQAQGPHHESYLMVNQHHLFNKLPASGEETITETPGFSRKIALQIKESELIGFKVQIKKGPKYVDQSPTDDERDSRKRRGLIYQYTICVGEGAGPVDATRMKFMVAMVLNYDTSTYRLGLDVE